MSKNSKIQRLIRRFIRQRYLNYWIVLSIDAFLSAISSAAAYFVVSRLVRVDSTLKEMCCILSISFLISGLASLALNTYRHIIRYSTLKDLWRTAVNVLFKISGMFVAVFFVFNWKYLTGNQLMLCLIFDAMFTAVLMVGVRVLMLVCHEALFREKSSEQEPILIYGINEKSVALKLRLQDSTRYEVIGFCINGNNYKSYKAAGLPIYHFNNEIYFQRIIEQKGIKGVLFAKQQDIYKERDRLILYCGSNRIKTLIAPGIDEANANNINKGIRTLKIEDLLGREEICINMDEVMADFRNKTVLVTGAAGSIGGELCRQIATLGVKQLILFDSAETPLHNIQLELEKTFSGLNFVSIIGDVRIKARVEMVYEKYHPQIVLHAAAYKHVPLMELNPCEAALVNVIGTRHVADMAVKYEVEKMIMVSTDKVVNPTNIMGASKRLAEIYIQSLGCAIENKKLNGKTRFITTRFGNVLGSNGSVIPRFKEQIENGGPVTVTHPDIIRFFMTIPEACRLVLEAATLGKGNEIFVFEMGKPVKIVDLAKRMIILAGYKPDEDIRIEFTGLRPGEKLYEELLNADENTIPTNNKNISAAKVRRYEYSSIVETYNELEILSWQIKIDDTVRLMKQMIPEFISQNSKYCDIDKELNPNVNGTKKRIAVEGVYQLHFNTNNEI
ncbi:MAG: polysaccharide biosynthesis protein [Prevotellaceae bacterium]|jgi:FlaA1/EpsC-like NDP-sugar epimerase|nr:polysaccharide biosynthesis protein [Prevotellaceae bacterium]